MREAAAAQHLGPEGTPLINVNMLHADGGSHFVKVHTVCLKLAGCIVFIALSGV